MISLSYELESRHGTPQSVRAGDLLRPITFHRAQYCVSEAQEIAQDRVISVMPIRSP